MARCQTERYQLLVGSTELQKSELRELRERNASLHEQQGRQELATRKVRRRYLRVLTRYAGLQT